MTSINDVQPKASDVAAATALGLAAAVWPGFRPAYLSGARALAWTGWPVGGLAPPIPWLASEMGWILGAVGASLVFLWVLSRSQGARCWKWLAVGAAFATFPANPLLLAYPAFVFNAGALLWAVSLRRSPWAAVAWALPLLGQGDCLPAVAALAFAPRLGLRRGRLVAAVGGALALRALSGVSGLELISQSWIELTQLIPLDSLQVLGLELQGLATVRWTHQEQLAGAWTLLATGTAGFGALAIAAIRGSRANEFCAFLGLVGLAFASPQYSLVLQVCGLVWLAKLLREGAGVAHGGVRAAAVAASFVAVAWPMVEKLGRIEERAQGVAILESAITEADSTTSRSIFPCSYREALWIAQSERHGARLLTRYPSLSAGMTWHKVHQLFDSFRYAEGVELLGSQKSVPGLVVACLGSSATVAAFLGLSPSFRFAVRGKEVAVFLGP